MVDIMSENISQEAGTTPEMQEQMNADVQNIIKRMDNISYRASVALECFGREFPEANVMDVATFMKYILIDGCAILSKTALMNGEHACVKQIMNDVYSDSIAMVDKLIPQHPELADDYMPPIEEKAPPVKSRQGKKKGVKHEL